MFKYKHIVPKSLLRQVAKDFFVGNPVKFGIAVEGQKLTQKGLFYIGCRAGPYDYEPSYSIDNLFHEMGHLAEREIDKLLQKPYDGWGFRHGRFWKVGHHSGYEFQTDQAVMRESRVWAYQLSLARHYGINVDPVEVVGSARYIDGFCFYKSRFKDRLDTLGYTEGEEEAIKILAEETEKQTAEFSFDNFCKAWDIRMSKLK
jgi:hypothetical protein